ncbi:hypothetical protein EYF80_055656 [Liparis tanakae]|uniref:Uncharacterized protein n=1 Tax=Liparis tanakae TaxID=230148 RepID=A0A4Z2F083_9TELE|nr:hypothetical protein EYF80_055656 [Liparis tanakae]
MEDSSEGRKWGGKPIPRCKPQVFFLSPSSYSPIIAQSCEPPDNGPFHRGRTDRVTGEVTYEYLTFECARDAKRQARLP